MVFLHGLGRHRGSLLEVEESRNALLAANIWVVLPEGEEGWYINSPVQQEARYEDYLGEVIAEAKARFGLRQSAERWAIGGWSMGGYGAVRYGEAWEEKFGIVAAVIGALDFPREETLPEGQNKTVPVDRFGEDRGKWRKLNPVNGVARLRGKEILVITADEAFDRVMNENFSAALEGAGIPHTFRMLKGGHTFSVVQEALPLVLNFVREATAGGKGD